jgi:hypothetical protein
VIDLARQVHEQADETENPHVSGKGRAAAHPAVIARNAVTKQSSVAAIDAPIAVYGYNIA